MIHGLQFSRGLLKTKHVKLWLSMYIVKLEYDNKNKTYSREGYIENIFNNKYVYCFPFQKGKKQKQYWEKVLTNIKLNENNKNKP